MPAPIRGSDVHLSEDIRRMMRAIAATHEAAAQVNAAGAGEYQQGYSAGFFDGIAAIAEALGIAYTPGSAGNIAIGIRWEG